MNRRKFMKTVAGGAFAMMAGEGVDGTVFCRRDGAGRQSKVRGKSRVSLIKTADRSAGITTGNPTPRGKPGGRETGAAETELQHR